MMPLQRHELVPIDELFEGECTPPKSAACCDFCFEDENAQILTTFGNRFLLRYAEILTGNVDHPALPLQRGDMGRLGQRADNVTPAHHRQAGLQHKDLAIQHEVFDHAASAGALE